MRCPAATTRARPTRFGRAVRCRGLTLALLLGVPAVPADAGPWAQPDGTAFVSLSITGEEPRASFSAGTFDPDTTVSLYGQLGLGYRLTLGADLGWGDTDRMAAMFLRRTLTAPDSRWQAAIDGGLAWRRTDGGVEEGLFRIGASLGHGFGGRTDAAWWVPGRDGGWLSFDAIAYVDADGALALWQAETTLGLNMGERGRGILALKVEEWEGGDLVVTARPSFVFDIGEATSLQAGLVAGLEGSDTVGLSLSLWQEF